MLNLQFITPYYYICSDFWVELDVQKFTTLMSYLWIKNANSYFCFEWSHIGICLFHRFAIDMKMDTTGIIICHTTCTYEYQIHINHCHQIDMNSRALRVHNFFETFFSQNISKMTKIHTPEFKSSSRCKTQRFDRSSATCQRL